jgi:hypothetical protein
MVEQDLTSQIRQRAYQIWLAEGCPEGRERIHWLRAEAEVREKYLSRSQTKRLHRIVVSNDKLPSSARTSTSTRWYGAGARVGKA